MAHEITFRDRSCYFVDRTLTAATVFWLKGKYTMRTISRDELKRKIDLKDSFLLVETLPETAYHHARLPGAINLPPDQLKQLAPQLLPDKNAEIVVYCASPT
jgi:rhodanese-related sulfurtransferase